jgi:ribosome-binding factor A
MKAKNTTDRARRMASTVQHIVAIELKAGHYKDPAIEFVTITEVRMSGDLHAARIYWTILDEQKLEQAKIALNKIAKQLRGTVGRELQTRLTPELQFVYDELGETVDSFEASLARAQAADAKLAQLRKNAQYAGDPDPYKKKSNPNESMQ